jgi:hypothetical protein
MDLSPKYISLPIHHPGSTQPMPEKGGTMTTKKGGSMPPVHTIESLHKTGNLILQIVNVPNLGLCLQAQLVDWQGDSMVIFLDPVTFCRISHKILAEYTDRKEQK